MFLHHKKYIFLLLLTFLGLSNAVFAQKIVIREADSSWMGMPIPAKALAKKKFTFNRRWFQNLVTRFNYYYNARQTLRNTLEQAAEIHRDNYDSILTFYPYEQTDFEMLKRSLDSVILNAGIGVEVHDPRGKWIDDLYLLVGKAYYYQQNDKEAIAAFKYIIKNLGEKDDMGRPELVGTRAYHSESNISVVTPEDRKKTHRPARNDAFIWLIRANLDSGRYDKATALMNVLQGDPNLPERLRTPLYAIRAQFYLSKGQADSARAPLQSAITLQEDKELQARWQFILSQLYEQDKNWEKAIAAYRRVGAYKPPPLMKFYARLNQIRIKVLQNLANFTRSSKPLIEMAQKERYSRYRSIIYYNLGKLALQAGYAEKGIAFLKKSLLFNPKKKKNHFLSYALLADYYYSHRQYRPAKKYYDSAAAITSGPVPTIKLRTKALTTVVKNLDIIIREDSLQTLAQMPHDSLMAYLGQIVEDSMHERRKRNRILKGPSKNRGGLFGRKSEKRPLAVNNERGGANWYFYNNVAKAKGFSEFKAQWGNRPLADNWRLSNPNQPIREAKKDTKPVLAVGSAKDLQHRAAEDFLQKLLQPLPLTPQAIEKSEQKQVKARHQNINVFFLQLEDDTATLTAIDSMLHYHPKNPYLADIYYKLYLIYSRIPDLTMANHYKQLLLSHFADSKYARVFSPRKENAEENALDETITQLYDKAYISYLTGAYEKVSLLRDSALYLDPQNKQKARFHLLHAMMVLKTQSDSAGKAALHTVIQNNTTDTAIVAQAKLILNELQHKRDLVEHLMHLQLPANANDSAGEPFATTTDSLLEETPALPGIQAIAANKSIRQSASVLKSPVQAGRINGPEIDSLKQKVLRAQAVQQLTTDKTIINPTDSIIVTDSILQDINAPATPITPYGIDRDVPYFVVLSFKKTSGSLIKKTLEAFANYNQKQHTTDSIEASSYVLAHNQVILIFRLFRNETKAVLYYKEIIQKAPATIIPDVNKAYYRLFFISRSNFILLNNTQDFKGYLSFFYKHYK